VIPVKEALSFGVKKLRDKVPYPARDAASLLSHVLGKDPEYAYLHPEVVLSPEQYERFSWLIARRALKEPLAYIKGYKEFMGFRFKVDSNVLIPRPETEVLVETALGLLKDRVPHTKDALTPDVLIADIGCGSGAIGLSILKLVPTASAVLTDISPQALSLARENAEHLGVSGRALFLCGDLLEPLSRRGLGEDRRLDAILSNPPYVSREAYASLDEEIRRYEPRIALDGGERGLEHLERLISGAPRFLRPGGYLVLEIGFGQGDAVRSLFAGTGPARAGMAGAGMASADVAGDKVRVEKPFRPGPPWVKCWSVMDYAGIERVIVGEKEC